MNRILQYTRKKLTTIWMIVISLLGPRHTQHFDRQYCDKKTKNIAIKRFFVKILLLYFKIFSKHRHLYRNVPPKNIAGNMSFYINFACQNWKRQWNVLIKNESHSLLLLFSFCSITTPDSRLRLARIYDAPGARLTVWSYILCSNTSNSHTQGKFFWFLC